MFRFITQTIINIKKLNSHKIREASVPKKCNKYNCNTNLQLDGSA